MDFFHVSAKPIVIEELTEIFKFYDYKFKIDVLDESDEHSIIRHKKTCDTKYIGIEEFLLKEVFYRKKRNLKFGPIENSKNEVVNCSVTIVDIIRGNDILKHLLNKDSPFLYYINIVNDFGTFIRFAENKAQRLYWNPPLNAGIPLSEKKSPSYENIFLMHDFGHLVLPDLVCTGKLSKVSKTAYVYWRLLGESLTLTLNEMFVPNYLKNFPEFQQGLSIEKDGNNISFGYDKPYRLFEVLLDKVKDQKDVIGMKPLFRSAFDYFCKQRSEGYMNIIDKKKEGWEEAWTDFNARYLPVSMRGREWTEDNFDSLEKMKKDYEKWWNTISKHSISDLNFVLLDTIESLIYHKTSDKTNETNVTIGESGENITEDHIMDILFEFVWKDIISKIFTVENASVENLKTSIAVRAFKRYMFGNVFLLIMHNIDATEILNKLDSLSNSNGEFNSIIRECEIIIKLYRDNVILLYKNGFISLNEYHNYKNIFLMIPPNILRKEDY